MTTIAPFGWLVRGPFQVTPFGCPATEPVELLPGGFGDRVAPPQLVRVVVTVDLDDGVGIGGVIEVVPGPVEPIVGVEPFDYFLRVHGLSGRSSICSRVACLRVVVRTGLVDLVLSASEQPV